MKTKFLAVAAAVFSLGLASPASAVSIDITYSGVLTMVPAAA
jgi:hypothetical protein